MTKDRAFVYAPTEPQKTVLSSMVGEFVDRVFNGSASPLLQHLIEDERLSAKDITEIQKHLKQRKAGA